jgi:hypothetical protein
MSSVQTPNDRNKDKQRFDELVAIFIAGGLSVEDDLFFKEYIARHPEAMHSIIFALQIKDTLRHIQGDRDTGAAQNRFIKSFKTRIKRSPWTWFANDFVLLRSKPLIAIIVSLFLVENIYIFTQGMNHHYQIAADINGDLVVARADASFILNHQTSLGKFFDVVKKHHAVVIYSAKKPTGIEVQVDLKNANNVLALADELANEGVVIKHETRIAQVEKGSKTWVPRADAKPHLLANSDQSNK